MTFLFVVIAIVVIAAVAILITGRWNPDMGLGAAGDHRPDLAENPQFDVVIRGYRMDEVDAKIAELQQKLDSLHTPENLSSYSNPSSPLSRKAP